MGNASLSACTSDTAAISRDVSLLKMHLEDGDRCFTPSDSPEIPDMPALKKNTNDADRRLQDLTMLVESRCADLETRISASANTGQAIGPSRNVDDARGAIKALSGTAATLASDLAGVSSSVEAIELRLQMLSISSGLFCLRCFTLPEGERRTAMAQLAQMQA